MCTRAQLLLDFANAAPPMGSRDILILPTIWNVIKSLASVLCLLMRAVSTRTSFLSSPAESSRGKCTAL